MTNINVQEPMTARDAITVFAVDDDPVTRRMLKAIFERNGYRIETAATANEALLALAVKKPDLIILDVVMPGISGFELCKKIKENKHLRNVPVLFLTGESQPKDYKEGHDSGAMMYVPKPVREESLLRIAQMFLPALGA